MPGLPWTGHFLGGQTGNSCCTPPWLASPGAAMTWRPMLGKPCTILPQLALPGLVMPYGARLDKLCSLYHSCSSVGLNRPWGVRTRTICSPFPWLAFPEQMRSWGARLGKLYPLFHDWTLQTWISPGYVMHPFFTYRLSRARQAMGSHTQEVSMSLFHSWPQQARTVPEEPFPGSCTPPPSTADHSRYGQSLGSYLGEGASPLP